MWMRCRNCVFFSQFPIKLCKKLHNFPLGRIWLENLLHSIAYQFNELCDHSVVLGGRDLKTFWGNAVLQIYIVANTLLTADNLKGYMDNTCGQRRYFWMAFFNENIWETTSSESSKWQDIRLVPLLGKTWNCTIKNEKSRAMNAPLSSPCSIYPDSVEPFPWSRANLSHF